MTAPEIQQEIEQTRERLGRTVDELAAKADVKARARTKAAELTAKATTAAAKAQGAATAAAERAKQNQAVQRRWPLAAAAVGVVLVGSVVLWRRRKK
jgi:hypothetical protein